MMPKIDCGHHSGVIEGQQSFRFDEQAVKVGGGRLKLFVFMLFPHEGLDDPDGGNVFLHTGVEVVIAAEDFVENLHGDDHDAAEDCDEEDDSNQEHQAQLGTDDQAHDVAEDKSQRGTDCYPNDHHEGILHIGDICGHPGHQTRDAELINVGKGEGLNIAIDGLPQVGCQSGGSSGCGFTGQSGEYQSQESHYYHQSAITVNRWQDWPAPDHGQ